MTMRLSNFTSALVLALIVGVPVLMSPHVLRISSWSEAIRQQDSQTQSISRPL